MFCAKWAALLVCSVWMLALPQGIAAAQSGGALTDGLLVADRDAQRARQGELFTQLIDEPDNLDLMFEYAKLSVELEDYEAAISTMERMLIYRQDLPRVRLELGVAYFRLGSYSVSEIYFDQVLADAKTPDTVRERVDRYKQEINKRTRTSAFTATATVGVTHATNATLGPDSNEVVNFGNILPLTSGQAESDTGLRVSLNVSHVYDLQRENDDIWRTDVSLFGVRYLEIDEGNLGFARVRTGPRLALDDQQFGVKVRPYLEAQYLHSEDRGLFGAFGVGAEVSETLSQTMSVFGDVGVRYRNYFRQEFSDEDSFTYYTAGGLAYIPQRDLILRGVVILELDEASGDQNSNYELGLRLSGEYRYESGIAFADTKWTASAYAEVRGRFFDEPDPVVDPNTTRRDFDFRAGARHIFALQDGFGIQLDVDGVFRESNIVNFDLENLSTTLSLRYQL